MTVVLDGGLATELEARGHDLSGELWSARLLADDPGAIVAAHRAFFRAGARIATTASYQASLGGFAELGLDRDESVRLLELSVELAREARLTGDELVAASIGPYGATLADGSEYRGHYGLSVAELTAFHRPRAEILAAAGPDLLGCETVPDVDEAEAILLAIEGLGVPAWLSYTIEGESTRAGQPLTEAFSVVRGNDQIVAVGVNCCDPRDVAVAAEIAREASGKPVIVYPNSGETWDARTRGWTGQARFSPEAVRDWLAAGVEYVGGCCRVSPDDIAALAAVVTPGAGSPPA
ncbi:homocysteine S-methyltransferase [Amycolatopsis deserti]|uniref:Homocysteine S-methyltransferase n=1 Tax=Amycolatopsis deserti TaxID=185696 RepID=A0ABQ3IJZ9_9PSEU|nr:homocysteine S-methyltransferase [Amycolatopsis deserti]GHE84268.1 homocysteine S-methyltransferase [Amycolatopsis deserti]